MAKTTRGRAGRALDKLQASPEWEAALGKLAGMLREALGENLAFADISVGLYEHETRCTKRRAPSTPTSV